MTPNEIHLVRSTFARIEPEADAVAAEFYRRVFERAPAARDMFGDDLVTQGRRLMTALGFVVKNLDTPDRVLATAHALGTRHAGYGVEPPHYQLVGEVLLDTLAAGLGPAFDAPTRAAWAAAYWTVADAMIEAADEVTRDAA